MFMKILLNAPKLLAPVARTYGRRLDQCGANAQGVFWRGETWQKLRFERMAEVFSEADTERGGIRINDFGCGYGAFFTYLSERPVMRGSTYYGYDISQEMIAASRDAISDPRATFIRHLWVTKKADYSIACGTYNLTAGAPEARWLRYVEASLAHLWKHSEKALAFNLLRDDADEQYPGLCYIDPQRFLDFCRRELSANVEMIDETPLPDVTFFVRK